MPVEFNYEMDERIDWFDDVEPVYATGDEYLDLVLSTRGFLSAEVLG